MKNNLKKLKLGKIKSPHSFAKIECSKPLNCIWSLSSNAYARPKKCRCPVKSINSEKNIINSKSQCHVAICVINSFRTTSLFREAIKKILKKFNYCHKICNIKKLKTLILPLTTMQ